MIAFFSLVVFITYSILLSDLISDVISFCFLCFVEFLKLNPLGYVPVLVDEDVVIADSLAIIMVSMHRLICIIMSVLL